MLKSADYELIRQPTKTLDFYEVQPQLLIHKGNRMILDFGREMVGYLLASAKGSRGEQIVLRFGEELNEDGSVRFDMRCNCQYEEVWTLSGEEASS